MFHGKKCWGLICSCFVFVCWAPSIAFGDAMPPLFEKCKVEKIEKNKGDCLACSASFKGGCKEEKSHREKGFVKVCRSQGGSFWSEVWCKNPEGQNLYSENQDLGCGCNAQHDDASLLFWCIGLFVFFFALRSRRRTHPPSSPQATR